MADPFSVTTGLCSIISLAEGVYMQGRQFLRACKHCPTELKALVLEVNSLKGTLEALSTLVDDAVDSHLHAMDSLGFAPCHEDLSAVATALNLFKLRQTQTTTLDKHSTMPNWPMKPEELLDLFQSIERHKSNIKMAAMADNLEIAMSLLGETSRSTKVVCELRDDELQRWNERVAYRHKVLEWLSPYEHDMRHKEITHKVYNKTGQWFLNAPTFRKWLMEETSPILWCPGIPGSGKSCLTSIVINHIDKSRILVAREPKVALAYVYFDYKNRARQTPENILAGLVKQLEFQLANSPTSTDMPPMPHILPLYERLHTQHKRPVFSDLQGMLLSIVAEFGDVYLLFDALDECDETTQRNVLLPLITQLPLSITQEGKKGCRIFVTARSRCADIQPALKPQTLELEIIANAADMELVVRAKIAVVKQKGVRISAQLEQDIVSAILDKADGRFLLANIHANYVLRPRTANKKRQALNVISTDLNSTYQRAMNTINTQPDEDQALALKALQWIIYAERPLRWVELQIALSIKEGQSKLDEDDFMESHDLIEQCAGLVILDQQTQTIRLVHYTVHEYLLSVFSNNIPHDGHLMIANSCINYLLLKDIGKDPCTCQVSLNLRLREKSFLEYSCRYWGYHCRKSGEAGDLVNKALHLMNDSARRQLIFQVFHAPMDIKDYRFDRTPEFFPPLHAAGVLGLQGVITALLAGGQFEVNIGYRPIRMPGTARRPTSREIWVNAKDSTGMTALHMATQAGHKATVQLLLEHGSDIEAKCKNGDIGLHQASQWDSEATVQLLLKQGADVEAQSRCDRVPAQDRYSWRDPWGNYGITALHMAARRGHESTVKLLLETGADIEAKSNNGETALHEAAWGSHEAVIRLLLENGSNIEAKTEFSGETALHLAARVGHKTTVRLLLEKRADIEAACDNGTALHLAVMRGHESLVRMLLEKGADVKRTIDFKTNCFNFGKTALHLVVVEDHEAIVRVLLENGADIDARNFQGETVLHQEVKQNHEATVRLLLKMGANVKVKSNNGDTALNKAAIWGGYALVQLLIEMGADVNAKDIYGGTALHSAAGSGYEDKVRLLLEKGADIVKDSDGDTALHCAADSEPAARLLLENGVDIRAKNNNGETALHKSSLLGDEATIRLLLERGADVNAKSNNGETALHRTAQCNWDEKREATVRLLLEKGADIEAKSNNGETTLHQAVHYHHEEMVRLLLERGANIEAKRNGGETALYQAVQYGYEEMIRLLLEKGADIEAKRNDGETALHQAVQCVRTMEPVAIVQLLLEKGADIEAKCNDGETALHRAVRCVESWSQEAMARLLLENGADVAAKRNDGETALHLAVRCTQTWNWKATVKLLLEKGADMNANSSKGETALQLLKKGATNRDTNNKS